MRVIQRRMGRENPVTTLRVYEHTLTFRNGVAEIETLSERAIHRLRAFGFRVERDTGPKAPQPAPARVTPPPAVETTGAAGAAPESAASAVTAPASPPAARAPKKAAKKKEDGHATTV